jgi:hypothetical protein
LIQPRGIRRKADRRRQERELCLGHARSATRHCGDKPLALIVAAQEAVFRVRRFHEEE